MSSLGSSERYIVYETIEEIKEIRIDYSESSIYVSIESIQNHMSGRGLDMSYDAIREILENVKILKDGEDVNVFTQDKDSVKRGHVKTSYAASTEDWDLFYMLLRLRTRR